MSDAIPDRVRHAGLGAFCACGHQEGYHRYPPGACQVIDCKCEVFMLEPDGFAGLER